MDRHTFAILESLLQMKDFNEREFFDSGFSTILSCMKSKLRWKASLLNNRQNKVALTEDDVEFLVTNTRFSVNDIREWYRQFIMECPQVELVFSHNTN